jgi:hypothetical protein
MEYAGAKGGVSAGRKARRAIVMPDLNLKAEDLRSSVSGALFYSKFHTKLRVQCLAKSGVEASRICPPSLKTTIFCLT